MVQHGYTPVDISLNKTLTLSAMEAAENFLQYSLADPTNEFLISSNCRK